jgi:hypothetical protein
MANYSKEDLVALARREATSAGLSPDMVPVFLGLIEQESNWRPGITGPNTKYGTAKGLTQMIDSTAKSLGVTDPYDPVQSLRGGARYFKQQLDRFGDVGLALAAYNWGPTNVKNMIDNPRGMRVPKETASYVPGVLGLAAKFGSQLAPSTATMAFFPGSSKVIKDNVGRSVALRTGEGGAADYQAALKSGMAPSGKKLGIETPPATPPLAGENLPLGAEAASTPPTMAGELPTMASVMQPPSKISSTSALTNVKSMDDYLKQQFGPLATAADPFPKGFDQKLMRVIEQA